MSEMTTGAEKRQRPTDEAFAQRETARLVRMSNLAIFVVLVLGLACVAYVQTTRFFSDRQQIHGWLVGLRLLLPMLALFLTGVITRRLLTGFIRRVGAVELTLGDYIPLFARCKGTSIALLTAAGLFSSACLLFGHRTLDVLLAGLPLLLLLITRPTFFSLVAFIGTVQSMRDQVSATTDSRDVTR
jgi:hypothetical protein